MQESAPVHSVEFIKQLHNWYAGPAGKVLADELQHKLAQLLPRLFGYYALQIGILADNVDLLCSSTINRKIYMTMNSTQGNVIANPLALPFSQDTLDLVVLPHTLDFSRYPHQVLREAHRVLIPDGHIVLIGFNPVSMMGLGKLILFRSKRAPWTGHFYTAYRLRDWLSLLGFTVIKIEHAGLSPPVQNLRFQQRLAFLGKVDRYKIGNLGGLQIFVAQKRVLTLTPRPQPQPSHHRIFPVNVAEPSARWPDHVGTRHYLH